MANIKFTNFARSTLSIGAASGATSLTLAAGTGVRFPSLGVGEYFYLTLENSSLVREIVKVTARATDVLTVVRAQDNTTAQTWNAGDIAALRLNAAAIAASLASAVLYTTATGSAVVPVGTTAQRDSPASAGYFRFNSTTGGFEGYNGASWGGVGGAQAGGVLYENSTTLTSNYTLTTGKNAMMVGPLTINSGVSLTIPSGQRMVVL